MTSAKKSFFDTVIFIYALERRSTAARGLFSEALREGPVGTSVITVMEYLTGCQKAGRSDIAEKFDAFLLDQGFEIQPIDDDVAREAAVIRAEHGFRQMDSLQLASAKIAEADVFYTNDKQLQRYQDDRMKIFLMDDLL